jgi:FixJ family two-component response regulator
MTGNHQGSVAVIDDDPEVLHSLKSFLESAGYRVGIYMSTMAFLEDRTLWPACLVRDQNMPQMTGLELAAKLRAQGMAIRCCLSGGALSPAAREPDHGVGAFNRQ